MRKINIKQFFRFDAKRIQAWLLNNDFEEGFKDRALRQPLIVAGTAALLGILWIRASSMQMAAARVEVKNEQQRQKAVDNYQNINMGWQAFAKEHLLRPGMNSQEWLNEAISSFAGAAGIELVSFIQDKRVREANYFLSQPAQFTLRGNYQALGNFIAQVENAKPFIGISQLRFTRAPDVDPALGKARLEIELKVFTLQERIGGAPPSP